MVFCFGPQNQVWTIWWFGPQNYRQTVFGFRPQNLVGVLAETGGSMWCDSLWAFGLPEYFRSGNSGNKNQYPISASKIHYPQIRVPANSGSGSGIPELPDIQKTQQIVNYSSSILKS
jgi:hypothetical protein